MIVKLLELCEVPALSLARIAVSTALLVEKVRLRRRLANQVRWVRR